MGRRSGSPAPTRCCPPGGRESVSVVDFHFGAVSVMDAVLVVGLSLDTQDGSDLANLSSIHSSSFTVLWVAMRIKGLDVSLMWFNVTFMCRPL